MSLSDLLDRDAERYKEGADFRAVLETDAEAAKVFETARGIENMKRQWGVHAAGVIMSAEPLLDVLPIMKREDDGAIITQFDQPPLEKLGLIKMDFLGLRNLTLIEDALQSIKQNTGAPAAIEDLDLDADQKTYDLLARGDTLGVFQLDGGAMRALLKQLKPDQLRGHLGRHRPVPAGPDGHELAHQLRAAQERAGGGRGDPPRARGAAADILGGTYGLIVYQEQVMAVAQKVAGFTLGQADILRRAMGKKKKSELDKQYDAFSAGGRTATAPRPPRCSGTS